MCIACNGRKEYGLTNQQIEKSIVTTTYEKPFAVLMTDVNNFRIFLDTSIPNTDE